MALPEANDKQKPLSYTVSYCETKLEVVIDWEIPSFKSLKTQKTCLQSEKTLIGTSAWSLSLYPTDSDAVPSEAVGLYLEHEFLGARSEALTADCVIGIVDATDDCVCKNAYSLHDKAEFDADTPDFGTASVISHNSLFGTQAARFLKDDVLKLRAIIKYQPVKRSTANNPERCTQPLKKRLRTLSESDVGKDFVLVTSDKAERHVHRAVLSASSPVFAAMFESGMKEGDEGRCDIPDIPTIAVDAMLRYMYYDSTENVSEMARSVLVAADKYQLTDLKEECERLLALEITDDTVAEMILLADKVSASILKQAALCHVTDNLQSLVDNGQLKKVVEDGDKSLALNILSTVAQRTK